MATEVVIPKMGMTMEDGTLVEWLVPDGTTVTVGQPLFHMVTEKLDCDVEAEADGILRHVVEVDTTLVPGGVVGYLLAEAEPMPTAAPSRSPSAGAGAPSDPASSNGGPGPAEALAPASASGSRPTATPNARRVAARLGVDLVLVRGTGPGGRITSEDVEAFAADAGGAMANEPPAVAPGAAAMPSTSGPAPAGVGVAAPPSGLPGAGRAPASPIARKLADRLGVDLAEVQGSGPGGRILREDVEAAVRGAADTPTPAPSLRATAAGPQPGDRVRLVGMRGTIAKRMHASLQEMAQLTLGTEVDVTRAVKLRERLKRDWAAHDRRVPTYTDLVVKACASALLDHPSLNATVGDDAVELLTEVHIGLAVALDAGLVVPVIRHAAELTLAEVAAESARLAEAARSGGLSLDDLSGGTFSVTTLGGLGVDFFTPVVNPPNVAIMGVGRVRDGVRWKRERPKRRQLLTLSLTFDHRAVDGAPAAAFLAAVGDLLEAPTGLLT